MTLVAHLELLAPKTRHLAHDQHVEAGPGLQGVEQARVAGPLFELGPVVKTVSTDKTDERLSRCASKSSSDVDGRYMVQIASQRSSGSRTSDHIPPGSVATRRWRLRGVPTPHSVRIKSPRFSAAVWSSTRLRMFV